MKKLSKKHKIYLLCIGSLFVLAIICCIYSFEQKKKNITQKQEIKDYINSIIREEDNINSKLNSIKNGTMITIGDYSYISEQLKRMYNDTACLYFYEYNKVDYLDSYTQEVTNYNNYKEYKDYLEEKYLYKRYSEVNKTAQDLIDAANPDRRE